MNKLKYYLPLLFGLILIACKGEEDKNDLIEDEFLVPAQILSPSSNQNFKLGNVVPVKIRVNIPEEISELSIYFNDSLYQSGLSIKDQTIEIQTTSTSKVGRINLRLEYTSINGRKHADNREITFLSDKIPGYKSAEIVTTYPHDVSSYTQGLEFYKGVFFEGTGQYNQSILAEVDLKSGKQIRSYKLPAANFGEGITILNDTIYQLTYRAQKCYIYDLNFELIGSHNYDGEGWGLCNDGENLLMTNGSNKVFWRNPKTFEIVKTIEVFDNLSSVVNLNELELIGSDLYVNLYTKNQIAQVDTATGKVLNYIDCTSLAQAAQRPGNDVLNGIAHNPLTNKTYMTGKWWPSLFEVKFN